MAQRTAKGVTGAETADDIDRNGPHVKLPNTSTTGCLPITSESRTVSLPSCVVNEKSGISPEMAIRLSKAFGGTPETWVRMQAAFDLAVALKGEKNIRVERYEPHPLA